MQVKKFHCKSCEQRFQQTVFDAALKAICPQCGQFASIVRWEMGKGLSPLEAVLGAFLIIGLIKLISDS